MILARWRLSFPIDRPRPNGISPLTAPSLYSASPSYELEQQSSYSKEWSSSDTLMESTLSTATLLRKPLILLEAFRLLVLKVITFLSRVSSSTLHTTSACVTYGRPTTVAFREPTSSTSG